MHPRVLLALVLVCAGLMGAVLVLAGGRREDAAATPGFAGATRPPIPPTEPAGLVDQSGQPVSLRALRGRPVVVTFLYTSCRDSCPLTAQQIRGALDRLGHDVPALAVSVDPGNDTPAAARAFLARQHLAGRMAFLTGPRAALARQWRAYGIQPQGGGEEHTAWTVLLDSHGVQRVGWPSDRLTPEGLAADLRRLEGESGAARAATSR